MTLKGEAWYRPIFEGKNYVVRALVKKQAGLNAMIWVREQPGKFVGYGMFNNGGGLIGLGKQKVGVGWRDLLSKNVPPPGNQFSEVAVACFGDQISTYFNGKLAFAERDTDSDHGGVRVSVTKGGHSIFRNLELFLLDGTDQTPEDALASVERVKAGSPKAPFDGFAPLFNGNDLTGWKTHPDDQAKWEVVDGCITATGRVGHLFSERGDYRDFVCRIEAKINSAGNSGQFFRAQFQKSIPRGYEAQINADPPDRIKTGSLFPTFNRNLTEAQRGKITISEALHKPDEWFTQEVTAIGNRITISVNGQTTVDFVDDTRAYTQGHFAIQHSIPACKVFVRKIEVKELTPSVP